MLIKYVWTRRVSESKWLDTQSVHTRQKKEQRVMASCHGHANKTKREKEEPGEYTYEEREI